MIIVNLSNFSVQQYIAALAKYAAGKMERPSFSLGSPFKSGSIRLCYSDRDISILRTDIALNSDMFTLQADAAASGAPLIHVFGFSQLFISGGSVLYHVQNRQQIIEPGQRYMASYNRNDFESLLTYPRHIKTSSIYVQVSDSWLSEFCGVLAAECHKYVASAGSAMAFPLAPASRMLGGHHSFFEYFDTQKQEHEKPLVYEALVKYLNGCFLQAMSDRSSEEGNSLTQKIDELVMSILANLGQPLPSLQEASYDSGLNPHTIRAYFRKAYGTSFHEYFTGRQMDWAQHHLAQNNGTIKVLSHQLGFSSPSHFAKTFKKHTGILPSESLQEKS